MAFCSHNTPSFFGFRWLPLLGCLLLAFFLVACASKSKKEEENVKKAKLPDYEKQLALKRLWKRGTGEGDDRHYLRLQPVIAEDKIFAANADGEVHAFDESSGKRLWRVKTDYALTGGLGADSKRVLFGTKNGLVVALSTVDGSLLWQAQTTSEVLAPPVSNGSVVVVQTIDARVFAFNAESGVQLWSYDHISPVLSLRGTASPVIVATQVICAFDNGQLVSFSIADGSRTWESRVAQPKGRTDLERIVDVEGRPAVQGGIVYAASYQGSIGAFGRAQGNAIWKKSFSTVHRVVAAGGKVFAIDERSRITAFNSANGDIMWDSEALLNRNLNAPTLLDDYLATIDEDGHLHLLSQADGSYLYRTKPAGSEFHAPMLSHQNKLIILSDNGQLSSYELHHLSK